jgi:hypothetical protein
MYAHKIYHPWHDADGCRRSQSWSWVLLLATAGFHFPLPHQEATSDKNATPHRSRPPLLTPIVCQNTVKQGPVIGVAFGGHVRYVDVAV